MRNTTEARSAIATTQKNVLNEKLSAAGEFDALVVDSAGCGAHLKNLRRSKSGRFDVEQAISVDKIRNGARDEILERILTLPEVSRMRGA